MTGGIRPMSSTKPKLIERAAPFLLVTASVIIGILLVETFCRLFLPTVTDSSNVAVFFDGRGTIFRNQEDIFTFVPNNDIRLVSVNLSNGRQNVEYDYRFRTNNFGLVQDSDISPGRNSVLVVGDSYTQGQGAEPWFRQLDPEIAKHGYQAINGGLMGTGFEQWLKLARNLETQNVVVRKVAVVFISDDFYRRVWNFAPARLQCLASWNECAREEGPLFRLPPTEDFLFWAGQLKGNRPSLTKAWLKEHVARVLPATISIYNHLRKNTMDKTSIAPDQTRDAIAEFVKRYGRANVIFVHLPQKHEFPEPIELGKQLRRWIQDAGGKLFDGFKLCQLTTSDYHTNDQHPNSSGYAKIASCVASAIKDLTHEGQ